MQNLSGTTDNSDLIARPSRDGRLLLEPLFVDNPQPSIELDTHESRGTPASMENITSSAPENSIGELRVTNVLSMAVFPEEVLIKMENTAGDEDYKKTKVTRKGSSSAVMLENEMTDSD